MEGDTPVEAAKNLSRDAAKERHCPVLLDAKKDKDLSVAERVSMNIAKLLEEQKVSRRNVTGEVASLLPHADDIHYPCATLPSSTTPPVTMVRTGTTMEPDHKEEHVKMEPDHKEESEEKLIKIATSTQTSLSNRKRSAEKEWSSVPSIAEMAKTRKRVKLTKPQTLAAATLPMRRRSPRVNALPVKKEGISKLEVKTRDRQESKVREKPLKEESSNQEVKVRKEREIHKEKSVSKRTRQSQIKEETLKKESAGKTKERATKKQKLTDNSKEKVTSKRKKGTQQINTEKEGRPNDQSTNVKIDLYKNIPKFKLKKHRESQIHWIAMFEELKEYIMKHGHAEVPKKHGELGNFVHNQRQHFPMQRLRAEMETSPMWKQTIDDRETALRSIGYRFECNVNERKWSEKFDQLIQYKKDNGHLQIAQRHGKLGRWASQQKKYYAQGDTALTKERIDKLNGIGFRLSADKNFTWDFHWDNMFRKLLAYKKANGHSNPHRNEPLVGSWVRSQRNKMKSFKAGKIPGSPNHALRPLTQRQINALNEIGFKWTPVG